MSEHKSVRTGGGTAQIVERKGEWSVRVVLRDGTRITAQRRPDRRIIYDKPERVPWTMKKAVVPELFKTIDDLTMGTRRSGA